MEGVPLQRPVDRVLIIGSSLIVGALGRGIENGLEDLGYRAERRSKSASGLSRPDFFDWPEEVGRALREFTPDATIVMFGGNDAQGIFTRAEPRWIHWPKPEWSAWYAQRVAELADQLTSNGERLVWLGAPRMRSRELDSRMARINAIYAQQMSIRPNATFISTAPALVDQNGKYAQALPVDGQMTEVRTFDGVHVTIAGARRVVDHVNPRIDAFLAQRYLRTRRAGDADCIPGARR